MDRIISLELIDKLKSKGLGCIWLAATKVSTQQAEPIGRISCRCKISRSVRNVRIGRLDPGG